MSELDALAANRANWDDRADVHARSQMYDVAGFLADPTDISRVVRNDPRCSRRICRAAA